MIKNVILAFLTISLFVACGADRTPKSVDADNNQYFGKKITADQAITYDNLLTKVSNIGDDDKVEAKVKGKIESVCQVKGCWMNIVSDDSSKEEMFVKFEDYGFFMPLDCSGKTAIMDGYAFRETTSVEELRHYAEDEGKSAEEIAAITEPEQELKFLATGVILLDK